MRVVLDSNVLISARLEPRGPSARLLRAWTDQKFELVVSPLLLDELADVLGRERLRRWLTEEDATVFVASLRRDATVIDDAPVTPRITPDPDDDYVVALARSAEVDYLVSGDRHLTEMIDPDPPVVTPRAFVELLR